MILPPPPSSSASTGTSTRIPPVDPDPSATLTRTPSSRTSSPLNTGLWRPPAQLIQALSFQPDLDTCHVDFRRLPWSSQRLLSEQSLQSERWYHKPYFRDGVRNRRIALLNGYHQADRLVACMMQPIRRPGNQRPYWKRCSLPRFCEFCAYLRGQLLLKKYAKAWEPGSWSHLTFSLEGFVTLVPGYEDALVQAWESMRASLRHVFDGLNLTGAVGFEELSVAAFYPEILLGSHLHVLIYAPHGIDVARAVELIRARWLADHPRIIPDLRLDASLELGHFLSCLRYQKPIDLLTPYVSGHALASAAGELEVLHQNIAEFFSGYDHAVTEYRRFWERKKKRVIERPISRTAGFLWGTCHGSSAACVATPTDTRFTRDHLEAIRALCSEAWADDELRAIMQDGDADA